MHLDDARLYPIYAHLEDRRIPLVFMAGRFLFGPAYPFVPLADAVRSFLAFPLKEEVIVRVLYANAARLLGLAG